MNVLPKNVGWIEVICGPMFSGKTEELIRRLKRAELGQQRVQIFKPSLDRRYGEGQIVSHSEQRLDSIPIERAEELFEKLRRDTQVVGIDEVQFFGAEAVRAVEQLADRGLRVIVAGLDQDYRGVPFEPMPQLLAVAEYITKELAVCVICGNPAHRSQRLSGDGRRILVGARGAYEARCRGCFRPDGVPPEARPTSQSDLPLSEASGDAKPSVGARGEEADTEGLLGQPGGLPPSDRLGGRGEGRKAGASDGGGRLCRPTGEGRKAGASE